MADITWEWPTGMWRHPPRDLRASAPRLALATGLLYARFTARRLWLGRNIRELSLSGCRNMPFPTWTTDLLLVTRMTTDASTVLQNTVSRGYRPLVRSPVMLVAAWASPSG